MVRTLTSKARNRVKGQDDATRNFYRLARSRYPGLPEEAEMVVYRKPSGAVNLRIVDPSFEGVDTFEREGLLSDIFAQIPGLLDDIGTRLPLTPQEAAGTMSYRMSAFDDPFGSDD